MSLLFFKDNICPGLPWFQCWTNIILKNPDAIQKRKTDFGRPSCQESMKRATRICEGRYELLSENDVACETCVMGN